ncbi:hypothetical protein QE152_g6658 [Popillia japonica]|uniref:Retrovirus-related Pol polyprotein from transposon TNT 1-94 n=1 Tax=Popillia japonica TaxID=7064 RepID=A0AAW1MHQ1_POPJA
MRQPAEWETIIKAGQEEDENRRNEKRQLRPRENLGKSNLYEVNQIEADVTETYEEAVKCADAEKWKTAMQEELEA